MLCRVSLPNGVQEVEYGTKLCVALLRDAGRECAGDADAVSCAGTLHELGYVGANVDGQIVELSFRVISDCKAVPFGDDYFGRHIIMRSAACLLMAAAREVAPEVSLEIGQSLHSQLFFSVSGCGDAVELGRRINERFAAMVKEGVRFNTRAVPPAVALKLIDDPYGDRAQLVHGWVGDRFGIVTVEGYNDLAYGPFVPTALFLDKVKVVGMPEGLLLAVEPVQMPDDDFKKFMLGSAKLAKDWNRRMKLDTVGKLNQRILSGKEQDLVQVSETLHEIHFSKIAKAIIDKPGVKVVFLSGPSSSGKTSSVRRLSTHLSAMGKQTIYVGLDDYYKARDLCPRDESGDFDFEALDALRIDRIKSDLKSLVSGKMTSIPRFDFVKQQPCEPKDERQVQIGPDQILMIEGIHGLNPEITSAVPDENCYKIFVSAMPQLNLDNSNRIPTTYSRLLRRIIRDRRYRGTKAEDTIARWPSVRRGETKSIFPYQGLADSVMNSSLPYEMAVFRTYAWPYLLEVSVDSPAYAMAREMLRLLSMVVPMSSEWIPKNSVLREFVGGSIYEY